MAHALRPVLLEHPAILSLSAARPVATPGAIKILDDGLALLRAQGLVLARATDILNAVITSVIWHTCSKD